LSPLCFTTLSCAYPLHQAISTPSLPPFLCPEFAPFPPPYRYYADIRDFITRGTSHNGVLGLTVTSYRTLFETPVVLEIVSRATILGTTYNQQFALSHTSLIGLASLNGCRCEVGPDPKRCRTNASSYAAAAAASFGG